MKHISITALALLSAILVSCGPGVDMPKDSSKGYHSARLVKRDPTKSVNSTALENSVNSMIQNSLRKEFTAKGMGYGTSSAELSVAYMVIYQEPGMTATYDDYFGDGQDGVSISELAHDRGLVKSERPEYFKRAGIVVDVMDNRTHKLIYRNFAAGDVVTGTTAATRAARIDAAVANALSGFFR